MSAIRSRRLALASLAIAPWMFFPLRAVTQGQIQVRINIPGPGSLPFLPIELIPLMGFDAEMGFRQITRYQPSGVASFEDMLAGNADLAAGGLSVLPNLAAKGKDIVAISPLSCKSMHFGLVVRRDLAGKIRKPSELAGKTIGISLGSAASKTYPQQVCELYLARTGGLSPNQVRWLGVIQKWEPIAGALSTGAADAVFVEEPFKSRLVQEKLGIMLADFGDPRVAESIPGPGHIRSIVATRRVWLDDERIGQWVRALRRCLVWMRASPPEEIVARLPIEAAARREYSAVLRRLPEMFSPTGRFSDLLIAATDDFLRAASGNTFTGTIANLVDERWAGRDR